MTVIRGCRLWRFVVQAGLLTLLLVASSNAQDASSTCSANPKERDPALREMSYDVGDGEQKVWVYVEPNVTSFYKLRPAPSSTKVVPMHNGFSGKFINLSNKKLSLYWEERQGGMKHLMRVHGPFRASGTATFPGHRFVFTPVNQPDTVLHRFIVGEYPDNIQVYDPYLVKDNPEQTEKNLSVLTPDELGLYNHWRRTLSFHEQYLAFTGRSYLANYLRSPPSHFMWRADYFDQEHWFTTRETHFIEEPPPSAVEPIAISSKVSRVLKEPLLKAYREPNQDYLNLTMKVISCAPRAFEIPNFLSTAELNHIMQLARNMDLKLSSTGDVVRGEKLDPAEEDTRRTRTSFNSWISREQSPIIDSIYRRAADLLRIDEALMRYRTDPNEYPDLGTKHSIAESLQLVHYEHSQEYTAHHDFGFSRIEDEYQGARFSTLLLYLNEGMVGGETSFPRWVNAESFKELSVKPEAGKAVLFYSQLPDGNLDDFSQHAARPVTSGEKWLTNLWVWEPIYE